MLPMQRKAERHKSNPQKNEAEVSFFGRAWAFHKFNNVTSIVQEFSCELEASRMMWGFSLNVYCLRSAAMKRMSVRTHEFSIIERYSTLFLPYWDYIKAWNWGFSSSSGFSFFLSSSLSEQYKNILWRKRKYFGRWEI